MNFSDTEIICAIKNNSTDIDACLEFLYKKNLKKILRYFANKGANKDDIRDMFQDSIIVFYEAVKDGRFEQKAKISTFLFSIVNNKWINKIKREKVETDAQNNHITKYEETSTDEVNLTEERKRKVAYFMGQLKEDCQQILSLFYYQRLSMVEIAKSMGFKNEQNARNKKAKCLKYLQQLLINN